MTFLKSKTLEQKAEDESSKVRLKRAKLANQQVDIELMNARKRKALAIQRLTA